MLCFIGNLYKSCSDRLDSCLESIEVCEISIGYGPSTLPLRVGSWFVVDCPFECDSKCVFVKKMYLAWDA